MVWQNILLQVAAAAGAAFGRTLWRAYVDAAKKGSAPAAAAYFPSPNKVWKIPADTAKEILSLPRNFQLSSAEDAVVANTKFEKMMQSNSPEQGGSVYIQMKILSARASLDLPASGVTPPRPSSA